MHQRTKLKVWSRGRIKENEKVKNFLISKNLGDRLSEHAETIDTVEHAAQQIGCKESEIAKTLAIAGLKRNQQAAIRATC